MTDIFWSDHSFENRPSLTYYQHVQIAYGQGKQCCLHGISICFLSYCWRNGQNLLDKSLGASQWPPGCVQTIYFVKHVIYYVHLCIFLNILVLSGIQICAYFKKLFLKCENQAVFETLNGAVTIQKLMNLPTYITHKIYCLNGPKRSLEIDGAMKMFASQVYIYYYYYYIGLNLYRLLMLIRK